MKTLRRAAVLILILAMVVTGLWWAFQPQVPEVEWAEVQRRDFEQTLQDDGRSRARDRMVVTMPWAGELERPAFKEGQLVARGDPLFGVRAGAPALVDTRTWAQWQARGAAAQASWQRAARLTDAAAVSWQRSALALSRAVNLAEQEFISRAALEISILDVQREHSAWAAAQEAERAALHELEQVRLMLTEQSLPGTGTRLWVPSPVDGRVLRVLQPDAAVLPAGMAVMEVGDVRRPEVTVLLLSQEALSIQPGMRVRLSEIGGMPQSPALAAVRQGVVRLIEPASTTKVSALGLEEQRTRVVIDPLDDLPEGDGYALRVEIVLQQASAVVQVPVAAVFPHPDDPARQAVFVLKGRRVQLTAVDVQARGQGQAWIAQGLQPGQRVVVYPPAALADGVRVRPVQR